MSEKGTKKVIRVGSRKSELALIQTNYVISCLKKLYPENVFEIHKMTTMGDRVLNVALPKIGEKSLFTKDLEDALTNGGVDFVVHSLKDLPTALPVGMAIGAVLEREDPKDVLVLNAKHAGKTLQTLPEGSVIGTSSLRRSAQLHRSYKNVKVCDIRGNLNTRLAKLDAEGSKFDGIILAHAGVSRMGWEKRISQVLEPEELLYAVGQGALAVECRSNDDFILDMLRKLCHLDTQCRILAERSFLKTLGGGCSAPVAVHSVLKRPLDEKGEIELVGAVWSLDGTTKIEEQLKAELNFETDNNNFSPRKKLKTTHDIDEDTHNDKSPTPPKIIDDSAGTSRKERTPSIDELITIHRDLFKKCPYSGKLTQNKVQPEKEEKPTNGNKVKTEENCPLDFPVGQDVMGECPFFNSTEQKVEASLDLGANGPKCPVIDCASSSVVAEKCPFFEHKETEDVKLIEYDENNHVSKAVPTLIDHRDELYCGMHRHKTIQKEIFDACEELGKKLANKLIEKGALEVMRCAQNEIHAKI
ncbi:porphobilinogen deaminase [Culicoides brevitarsis]|uniref:porphobilinogen deaminase n=1 Tax=Culicoides brevitarsis TaxID=469753 RepID=UPI00307CB91C